jgi:hypothetical protein
MRLPNLSPSITRRSATPADRVPGRVAALSGCNVACDPNKAECTDTACPSCLQSAPGQHTCQA